MWLGLHLIIEESVSSRKDTWHIINWMSFLTVSRTNKKIEDITYSKKIIRILQYKYVVCLGTLCNSPLQRLVRQPASQQAATAVFQLPRAPGMQREPRRAAAQACVREQRALSVPKKQPGGDFHPIGPNATAAGRARLGLRREPRDGALHGSTERTLCYEVLCSVKPHSAWASLCTAARKGTETDRKRGKRSGKK